MKRVFMTGASGDIGSAIKLKFESENYEVISPDRSSLDLSSLDSIDAYFQSHDAQYDVLIYCAGYNSPSVVDATSMDRYLYTQQINVGAFYHILKYLIPGFKVQNSGFILGVSSLYGCISREGRSAYAMSKHAMNGLIQTLALELGAYNVLVNTVSPGFVDTRMTRQNNSNDTIALLQSKIPLKRLAMPSDIASISYFLCSQYNTYITGQDIVVDGGFMAGGFQK